MLFFFFKRIPVILNLLRAFTINLRVKDFNALLLVLKEEGVIIVGEQVEEHFEKFAGSWILRE